MSYQPNIAVHPGGTVQRVLDSLGMTQKSLSERTGLTEKHISDIVNGRASITPETAILFENSLGGSAEFWNNLQVNYETIKVRLEQEKRATQELEQQHLKNFPYQELEKFGYVEKAASSEKKIINLFKFFGVNSLAQVEPSQAVAYRAHKDGASNQAKVATWLRCGEKELERYKSNRTVNVYDKDKLLKLLPKLKALSTKQDFTCDLINILASAGVILIPTPYFTATYASGATRWIGGNPVIQLSDFGKRLDKFWFTLFHEIGHVVLHGRKEQFISFDRNGQKTNEENEADNFAAESLISYRDLNDFKASLNSALSPGEQIKSFAKQQNIHPSIVAGRLQNDYGVYSSKELNKLHVRIRIGLSNE